MISRDLHETSIQHISDTASEVSPVEISVCTLCINRIFNFFARIYICKACMAWMPVKINNGTHAQARPTYVIWVTKAPKSTMVNKIFLSV